MRSTKTLSQKSFLFSPLTFSCIRKYGQIKLNVSFNFVHLPKRLTDLYHMTPRLSSTYFYLFFFFEFSHKTSVRSVRQTRDTHTFFSTMIDFHTRERRLLSEKEESASYSRGRQKKLSLIGQKLEANSLPRRETARYTEYTWTFTVD